MVSPEYFAWILLYNDKNDLNKTLLKWTAKIYTRISPEFFRNKKDMFYDKNVEMELFQRSEILCLSKTYYLVMAPKLQQYYRANAHSHLANIQRKNWWTANNVR